jgi:hypothetical protein
MKIVYTGSILKIIDGVKKANELLEDDNFYEAIKEKQIFDFSNATGEEIAASLKKCQLQLQVKSFKKVLTKELGYEDPNDPTSIHINVAGNKLNRTIGSIAGTFIHEAVHAADSDDEQLDYHHNGNKAAGNSNTAPYWIGNLAVQMIDHPAEPVDINAIASVAHAPEDVIEA